MPILNAKGDYDLEPSFEDLWNYNYKNGVEFIFEIQNYSTEGSSASLQRLYSPDKLCS